MPIFSKEKTLPEFRVPTLEEASPEYAAAVAKKLELSRLRSDIVIELAEHADVVSKPQMARLVEREEQIAELLGESMDVTSAEFAERQARYHALQKQLPAIEQALQRVEERISLELAKASTKIREQVAPEHSARIKAIAAALIDAGKAHLRYRELADDLNSKSIQWAALRAMPPSFFGMPTDVAYGAVAVWLNEAARDGHIDKSIIPREFCQ